jgi:hypothetical protein
MRLSDKYYPLPWREGIKGRGKRVNEVIFASFFTPTLVLPHQRGRGILRLPDSLPSSL